MSQGALYADDIHPNDNGHRICAYLLYSFVKNQINAPSGPKSGIPPFLYSDIYQYAGIHDVNDTLTKVQLSGWDYVNMGNGRVGYQSVPSSAGPSLIIQSNCREITLGIRMQPTDTSSIQVTIDGEARDTVLNNYFSMNYTKFVRVLNAPTNGLHMVRVEHSAELPAFTIDYVLYAGAPH